ncbi:Cof-type HAD-IIB family hydrolase [uncultured Anaerococcus sp.]|uniref:Cof-type HAD-IIB family hydrolase n=1 Tax=uncultured Anaerococcus sp. TaxID=293428 RepID=UPI00280BD2D4|nr:Cof-type HAD-IIB family hydrolase [uncultured Anaerococcus sp.]MDU5149580.1 Cof-type HAD-IIB family hydrolase [Anaerococcus prevotii]
MKNIKLIAFDLDGTLLNENRELSEYNIRAIKKLIKKDIKIVIATGRPYAGFSRFLAQLGTLGKDNYSITNTGSIIRENIAEGNIKLNAMNLNHYLFIKNIAKNYENLQVAFYTDDYLYIDEKNPNEAFIHDKNILKMETRDTAAYENEPICRINIMGKKELLDNFQKENLSILEENFSTMRNETFSFEILNKNSSKGKSLEFLSDHLNIERDQVMAFGDNVNDIEMIEYAGTSVAMENGKNELKSKAKYLAKSNSHDGVAKFLFDYFNL